MVSWSNPPTFSRWQQQTRRGTRERAVVPRSQRGWAHSRAQTSACRVVEPAGPGAAGGDGEELGRGGRSSGEARAVATMHMEENEEGEDGQKLTAIFLEWTASSGRRRRRRIDGRGLRRPRRKKMKQSAMQAVPALGARVGRSSGRWRSLQTRWGVEGSTVVMATASGALRCVR